jgi:transglutaminase-like putative cysteine protease
MKFNMLYRLSFYLMLFFATLALSVDATENPIAWFYPVAVAVGGVVAFMTVDRNPRLGLPRSTANLLGLASISLVLLEYLIEPYWMLHALGHWLVYLQLIKMFLPKMVEDDWFLFLLGLVQVLVGAVISQSDHVGITLFTWALLALWVLALFSLHRDALRFQSGPGSGTRGSSSQIAYQRVPLTPGGIAGPAPIEGTGAELADEPYPGLLDVPFLFSALRVMATTLALGGVIFLAMPRRSTMGRVMAGDQVTRHLTGFDEEVELGQMGEILENDSIVMSVELYDDHDHRITSPAEPLWRGVTNTDYDRGRWKRHTGSRESKTFPIQTRNDGPTIRQQIKLEASDLPVLFALRPVRSAEGSGRSTIEINRTDGTIHRSDTRASSYDYRVVSERDTSAPQLGENAPRDWRREQLLAIPETIRPRIESIARPLVEKVPPEELSRRANVLVSYLRDSGQFSYTLKIVPVDPTLDPVVDFLVNRKEGHCEFYASALTLMLRSIGIPARMVNGFKGGDWNDFAQVMNVRQKHAHSWVEAYLSDDSEGHPLWITLDPTPGLERDRIVARVGGFSSNFRQLSDLVRYIWVFYVVGYNADRQRRILYEPMLKLAREARSGFQIMGKVLREAAADLLTFQNVGQFISIRGFFVSFTILLFLVAVLRGLLWCLSRFLRWFRGPVEDTAHLTAGEVFYRRLAQLLAGFELKRASAETQQEFAHRAEQILKQHGSITEKVADVPRLVVQAFYRIRFGHRDLAPGALHDLEVRLDALEASLRTSRE